MTKAIKVAYTLGIIILLYFVSIFGIKTFYPEQSYYDYSAEIKKNCGSYPEYPSRICAYNDTSSEDENCKVQEREAQEKYDEKMNEYNKCSEKYDPGNFYKRNIFIIENMIGLIFVITAFFFLRIPLLANGLAFAGIMMIIDGFYEGWRVADKGLQFGIGILVLIVFITTALLLHKKTNNLK